MDRDHPVVRTQENPTCRLTRSGRRFVLDCTKPAGGSCRERS